MAQLVVESGPLIGQTLSFTDDEPIVIGSGDTCSLRLESPGVAEQHLVIKALKNGGFGVKRLDGRFLLNGKGADAARLADGDVLEVADTRLRFGPKDNGKAQEEFRVLGGFRLIEVLGKGGHGTVYRAEQMSLHREVALKVLPKETTRNPEFVGRFVAEARAAARLSHPNVVQVFDVGHDGDTYYLSMEIMEHRSLEDRLKREGKIPVEECLQLIIDAARGLSYAESMRIVHRDIKPDNVMVDSHGTAKIADLGLALSHDEEHGKIAGTPHFMSPEQVLGKPLDHRSDLYSLGCSFFRLLTGRNMFQRKSSKEILRAHVKDAPPSADKIDADLPADVVAVIDQLVEKDADDRYQSAAELIEDLEQALHPPAKKGLRITLSALFVVAFGGAIYWGVPREDQPRIVTERNPVDAELKRKLRETEAETRYTKLLLEQLSPLRLAASLETFSKHADYSGTKAAGVAIAKAGVLRKEEAARLLTTSARNAAITKAKDKLHKRLRQLIDAGEFRAAVDGFQPTDIADDILREEELQQLLRGMRAALQNAGAARYDGFKQQIAKGIAAHDITAVEATLADLEAILDEKTGWPEAAFDDRRGVVAFVEQTKSKLGVLRKTIAASRQSSAWANFRKQVLAAGGVLHRLHGFDTAGALKQASALEKEVAKFVAGPTAVEFLGVVKAAKAYEDAYIAAVEEGTVKVPLDVDGTVRDVIVKSFDAETGLTVSVPTTGGAEDQAVPLSALHGNRLREVFIATSADATHRSHRVAYVALHALWEHLDAARGFMARIDPEDDQSGTGKQRFNKSMSDFNFLIREIDGVRAPWQEWLTKELQAGQTLSRGLRAFSKGQYTVAHGYLENLQKRYPQTLAVQAVQ